MPQPVVKSFQSRNNTYWNTRGKSDKEGLVLVDEAISNLVEHKNWDNLSRFIGRAGALNAADRSKVMGVVRAAFGDQITYKKDPSHPTGGKISLRAGLAWDGVALLNSYGEVKLAIENGKGFRDADLHKALGKMKPEKAKPAADVEKSAKHIVKYLQGLNYDKPGLILHEVEKMLKAAAATKAQPVVLDKDGEPNH